MSLSEKQLTLINTKTSIKGKTEVQKWFILFGKEVKYRRQQLRMSQKGVADNFCDRSYIARIELAFDDKEQMELQHFAFLCDRLSLDSEELLKKLATAIKKDMYLKTREFLN